MKRIQMRTITLGAALAAFAACSDNPTVVQTPRPGVKPMYNATVPFNNNGVCMNNDAVAAPTGTISGVQQGDSPIGVSNCTSQDVKIAQANILSYQVTDANGNFGPVITFHPGDVVSCIAGSPIKLNLSAQLDETSTSARTDVGIWIATDGGNAQTGACNHYNLTVNPLAPGASNNDQDNCGDLNAGAVVDNFPLGVIDAICQTSGPTSTLLHVGSCLGWKEPGADTQCPLASQGETPNGYRWGTLFANKAKCNCDGFDVPITVHQSAKLEVAKACTPTTDPGTFDLLIDNSTTVNGVVVGAAKTCGTGTGAQTLSAGTNVNPGAVHSFGEGNFTTANYSSTYACVNRSATGPQHVFTATGDAAATGTALGPNQITLEPNEDVICTFTNVRKPQLTLVKRVVNDNGGTAVVGDFGITTNAGSLTFGSGVADGTGTLKYTSNTITLSSAGTYTLHENTLAGYTEGTWACNGTGAVTSNAQTGSVAVAAGENVTCTITNDDQAPSLTIVKRVVNDNGGTKTASDFGLSTTAGSLSFGAGVADGANTLKYTSTTLTGLTAGSKTLHENVVASYTEGTWACVGNAGAVNSDPQTGSVVLGLGESVTCTITNDDRPASLTIVKRVVNDNGGTKTVSDFGLSTTAGSLSFGSGVADGANTLKYTATTLTGLSAGSKTLHENTLTGYSEGTWSCTGASGAVATDPQNGSVVLGNGDAATCTITNDDIGGSLIMVKRVVNDNGGTKTVSDFGLSTTAGSLSFGAGVADGANTLKYTATAISVSAGTYTLHENAVATYTEGTWTCAGNAGAVNNDPQSGTVAVGLGETVTCTITNDDKPASLTIVKRVVNDNGGTKTVSDFGLSTTAGSLTFGAGVADGANTLKYTATTLTGLSAGSKTLHESTLAGYTEGTWACVGNAGAVNSDPQTGSVVLGLGESVTCTITNDDQPATLIIVKVVKGTGGTFGFTTTGAGLDPSFSLNPATDGSDQKSYSTLSVGSYSVTESAASGFVLTDLGCSDQAVGTYDPNTTRTVSTTLTNGETVTCTFTNEAQASQTTRTQGFWATHPTLTNAVWFGLSAGGNDFSPGVTDHSWCGGSLDTEAKVLGGFWSAISQTTTNKKRSSLDQARMQLAQQLLAAILNNAAFGSSPTGGISIAEAKADYCGTDVTAIKNAQSAMAAFNTSGDNGTFTPGVSANAKLARSIADLGFWDVLP